MDKAKILRLLDESDDIVSALYRQGANKDYKCKSLREKLRAISAEITEPPKSNGDRIRQMTDEEIAHWLNNEANYTCNICIWQNETSSCYDYMCEECVAKWLKQEVSEDAGND